MPRGDEVRIEKLCSGVESPKSVLHEEVMGSWELAKPSHSHDEPSPMRGSGSGWPEVKPLTDALERELRSRDAQGSSTSHSIQKSLVETLASCLTSNPHNSRPLPLPVNSWASTGMAAIRPGYSVDKQTQLNESSTSGRSSAESAGKAESVDGRTGAYASMGAGTTRVSKRRSRASRRVPTTVMEASSSDFRDMVQKLTGIRTPAGAPGSKGELGGHVVRPQPKRAFAGMNAPENSQPLPALPPFPQFASTHPSASGAPHEVPSLNYREQLQRSDIMSPFPFNSSMCKPERQSGLDLLGAPTSDSSRNMGLGRHSTPPGHINPSSRVYHSDLMALYGNLTRSAAPASATSNSTTGCSYTMPLLWDATDNERSRDGGYVTASRIANSSDKSHAPTMIPEPQYRRPGGMLDTSDAPLKGTSQEEQLDLQSYIQIDSWLQSDQATEMRV